MVVGPNGAGKTTLINAIAGVQRRRGGHACHGRRIAERACRRIASATHGIALVPEGRRLFTALTVRENLELGGYRAAAARAAGANPARGLHSVSGPRGAARGARGHALRRAAADGGDRPRADGPARAPAPRRALARPRACDRARAVPYHPGGQRARRRGAAGGAECRRGARDRAPGLRPGRGPYRRPGRAARADVATSHTEGILGIKYEMQGH